LINNSRLTSTLRSSSDRKSTSSSNVDHFLHANHRFHLWCHKSANTIDVQSLDHLTTPQRGRCFRACFMNELRALDFNVNKATSTLGWDLVVTQKSGSNSQQPCQGQCMSLSACHFSRTLHSISQGLILNLVVACMIEFIYIYRERERERERVGRR
jgi:hypothetical protein